jgi:predicted DNA-binding protein (MmcQ/YjbR family)
LNNERVREFLLTLPHVKETVQWGDHLVFWAGDKAIGGKMFAMLDLGGTGKGVVSMAAGAEGMAELLEREGIVPAPYLARAHWVCVERWDALDWPEWMELLKRAREIVHEKLPAKTKAALGMKVGERGKFIQRKKTLPETSPGKGAAVKKAGKKAAVKQSGAKKKTGSGAK